MGKETCAVVLAAGSGLRLGCTDIPKAMVAVGGKPILGYSLSILYESRFAPDSITVVVGAGKDVVTTYCADSARICEQPLRDGNLSAIEAALSGLPDRFTDLLIIHADDGLNLTQKVVSELLHVHESQDMAVTLLLSHNFRSSAHRKQYLVDTHNRVVGSLPVGLQDGQVNVFTGVYCFDRQFFVEKARLVEKETERERTITPILNVALRENRLGAVIVDQTWLGINTPTELSVAKDRFWVKPS